MTGRVPVPAAHFAADAFDVPLIGGVVATVFALAGLVATGWLWRSTAPRRVDAGPATMELRDETPAVVDLLVGGFSVEDDAVPATVVDLAQRRHLDIDDIGGEVVLRLRRHGSHADEELTRYERRVLNHIERHAVDGVVPAAVLTIGPDGVSERWFRGFVREVNRHGQHLGLCSRRFDLVHVVIAWAIVAVGFAPSWIVANAAPRTADPRGWGSLGNLLLGLAFVIGVGLVWLAQRLSRSDAQRDTDAGREAAAHWLGVRDHYRDVGDFEAKPAASVAIWDRHLAYATAMGLAPAVQRQLPFETEHDRHAWSRATGSWRRVKVRYLALVPGWGTHPGRLAFEGLIQAVFTGAIAFFGFAVARADLDVETLTDDQRRWIGLGGLLVAIIAAAACLFALVKLTLGVSDLFARRTVEGEVVRARRLRSGHRLPKPVQWLLWSRTDEHGMSRERNRTTKYHIAVDDGTDDSIVAHVVRSELFHSAPQGARVRIVVTPRIGYVRSIELLDAPRRGAASDPAVPHELIAEAGERIGGRISASMSQVLGHLESATADDGRPLLDQADEEGRTLRDRMAEASDQLERLRGDSRLRNSPVGGLLDSFLSSEPLGSESGDDRARSAGPDADHGETDRAETNRADPDRERPGD